MSDNLYAPIPMSWIGPVHISGNVVSGETAGWDSADGAQTQQPGTSYEAISIPCLLYTSPSPRDS